MNFSWGALMTDETRYILGDDLPKRNPWQDDRLGFAHLAEGISRVIIDLTAPSGYVIGVHGQWGSGKSTLLNFIPEYLKKHNAEHEDNQVIHIDFRPWIISGHQDLITAFFKILSEKLGPNDNLIKRFWKKIVLIFRGTTDDLANAAATVALTVDPSGGVGSGIARKLAKQSLNTVIGRFLEDPSLQKAYEDLRAQLVRSGKRFLVTVDDIDRLEDSEVKSIMQMVKSIGQLPNIVYLLAYDREIVFDVLDQGAKRAGPRFAEKVVQQEIELPKPTKSSLLTILDEELSFLTAASDDSMRWHYIVRDGVHRWIRSPRDVVRLSNAVKFSWPALEGEIDPQDLLAIEGLRLFDVGTFNWIRDNRDFLFAEGRFMLARDELNKFAAESLKKCIPVNDQLEVLRIMSVLFPQSAKWFEGSDSFRREDFDDVVMRRGIGSEGGYDSYFSMHPSSDAVSKTVVNDLMSGSGDVDGFEATIRSYVSKKDSRGRPMITKLLDELRVQYRGSRSAAPTQALLDALFRVGEEIIGIDWEDDLLVLSPRAQIGFLIRNMLEQWGADKAGERLIEAFQKGRSPAFLADVYVERGRELGVFKSVSIEGPVIREDDFKKLGEILLGKIKAAVNNDVTLKGAPFFFDIARSWAHLENTEIVKEWLASGMRESPEFLAKVGLGLVRRTLGTVKRRYELTELPAPKFYELSVLIEAGEKHLQRTDLTRDQRNLIAEIVRGCKQLVKGQSSEGTKEHDEL
jgi:hypothetical protein